MRQPHRHDIADQLVKGDQRVDKTKREGGISSKASKTLTATALLYVLI
jgi:hypothetical protein